MSKDKSSLNRGIAFLAGALPLIFIGPAVIHFAFINKQQPIFLLILFFGIAICITGVILGYKGLVKMVNSFFKQS